VSAYGIEHEEGVQLSDIADVNAVTSAADMCAPTARMV
jgi:hypothetical protein